MMNLYLVRHGSAIKKDPGSEQTLSDSGKTEVRKTAQILLKDKKIKVLQIFHSGKLRAQQTAEIIADALKPEEGVAKTEGLMPMDTPEIWGKRIVESNQDIMLVGHLPYMSNLASLLLSNVDLDNSVEFSTASALGLRRESNRWVKLWQVSPR